MFLSQEVTLQWWWAVCIFSLTHLTPGKHTLLSVYVVCPVIHQVDNLVLSMHISPNVPSPLSERWWSLAQSWSKPRFGISLRTQRRTWRSCWRCLNWGSSCSPVPRWRASPRASTMWLWRCCPSSLPCLSTSQHMSLEWTCCVSWCFHCFFALFALLLKTKNRYKIK